MSTLIHPKTPCASSMVWLVGAGPGDPDLLTVKAVRILKACTVWLVDDLVSQEILDLASGKTQIIKVGKRGGRPSTAQAFILRMMERYCRSGHTVARVKGGDPFIFGRGGEEMEWLNKRGIPVDSVSGITAGLAVGSALGLPLTHREIARGVTLVTAHTTDGTRPNWKALAESNLTIVCYMGMGRVDSLTAELLAAGFSKNLPVMVVQYVSCTAQRHIATTLEHLDAEVKFHNMASPSVIVLGEMSSRSVRPNIAVSAGGALPLKSPVRHPQWFSSSEDYSDDRPGQAKSPRCIDYDLAQALALESKVNVTQILARAKAPAPR